MKRVVLCAVVGALLMSAFCVAEEIKFREIEWGTQLVDVVGIFEREQQEEMILLQGSTVMPMVKASQFLCLGCGEDTQMDGNTGVCIIGKGLKVAGYDNVGYTMCFAYDVDDNGKLDETSTHAQLYAASYMFIADDLPTVYEDILGKLKKTYGEELIIDGERIKERFDVEDSHEECGSKTVVWESADGGCYLILNQFNTALAKSLESESVMIHYVWVNGDALLDRNNAIASAIKADEVERKKSDTSGL